MYPSALPHCPGREDKHAKTNKKMLACGSLVRQKVNFFNKKKSE